MHGGGEGESWLSEGSSNYVDNLRLIKRIERLKGELWIMSKLIKKYLPELDDVHQTLMLLKERSDIPRDARRTIELCAYKVLAIEYKLRDLINEQYMSSKEFLEMVYELCQVVGPYKAAKQLGKSLNYIYRLKHTYEVLKKYLDKLSDVPVTYLIELAYAVHDLGPKDQEFIINEFLKAYRGNKLNDMRAVRRFLKEQKSYVTSLHKHH